MTPENDTLYKFEKYGQKLGIRMEIDNTYDDWLEVYSYEVYYRLFRYNEDLVSKYELEVFDPSPEYRHSRHGDRMVSWSDYQDIMQKYYHDECLKAKELFKNKFL